MNANRRILYQGALYHVYNQGNDRHPIFRDDEDRKKYFWYLTKFAKDMSVLLVAYCLLTNHFHLFIKTLLANLPEFVQRLHSSYAKWYNLKHGRTGHLFTSRYKALPVQEGSYALELSRYIHLNPVRAGLAKLPEDWPWSSYRHYVGLETDSNLDAGIVLDEVAADSTQQRETYRAFVLDGLAEGATLPELPARRLPCLGDDEFEKKLTDLCIEASLLEQPKPPAGIAPTAVCDVLDVILEESGITLDALRESTLHSDAFWRNMFVFVARELTDVRLKELSELLHLSKSEVSRVAHRFKTRCALDTACSKILERVISALAGFGGNVKM